MPTGTVSELEPTRTAGGSTPAPAPTDSGTNPPRITRTIRPRRGWQPINLAELWRFRELLGFLIWRDVKVRYKQTVLGGAWALIQPVMTMIVFTIFFGRFGGMAEHVTVPYPVFAYAGLLAWTYFATTITQAGNSLVSSANLLSKVYFPRLIIPISSAGVGLVDFAIAAVLMFGLLAWYGVALTWQLLLLPVFLVLLVTAALGVGTLLAALVIAYRDFRYVLGFMVQLWMFASPLAYPIGVVPEQWRLVYALNPMVGVIDGFCAALLGTPLRWDVIGVSAASAVVCMVAGLFYFKRVERRFADIV
jgi:lipopolysaccharide transport system permease protein